MTESRAVNTLVPYLIVRDAKAAIDFYVAAFGAVETFRLVDPADGRIGHAELAFGGRPIYLADEYPDFGALSPDTLGGSPVKLHLEVADADAAVARAVEHGATLLRAVRDEFHGDRLGEVADPFGYSWFLSQRIAAMSPAEMQRRWSESVAG